MDDDIRRRLERIERFAHMLIDEVADARATIEAQERSRREAQSNPDVGDILDTDGACKLTGLSKSRIRALTSQKKIPHYKQGNKLYFRKRELENWLTQHPVRTRQQVESQAVAYCLSNPIKSKFI